MGKKLNARCRQVLLRSPNSEDAAAAETTVMPEKTSVWFEWKRVTNTVAHFRMRVSDDVFEFDATDLSDSLGELARATVSAVIECKKARAVFENEPGQHVLEVTPLGDGRIELRLSWDTNPYGVFERKGAPIRLLSKRIESARLLSSVLSVLSVAKDDCKEGCVTVGKYHFPDEEYLRLKNA